MTKTLRISQSAYIRDLLKKKNLTNCNSSTILMEAGKAIEMNKSDNYDKTNLAIYQRLINKLIYFVYGTRSDLAFIVRRLSKHNANL